MIFFENAPKYWEKDLPVIPLYSRAKRPIPTDWSRYHDKPIEDFQQQAWLQQYPDSNIGIVLGRQARMVVIDIDTDDEEIKKRLLKILPDSPWKRIGKKGMVLAYRYTGTRTFRIKNLEGETICEHLSERTQVVLPPSIHPDTGQPYKANVPLYEVIENLPALDSQIEQMLRGSLTEMGIQLSQSGQSGLTDFVSRGARDVAVTEKAGLFAYSVLKGERTLLEALGMLKSYNTEFVERVAGDDIDLDKHTDNLIKFLRRDVYEKNRVLPKGWDEGLTDDMKKQMGLNFEEDHLAWDFDEIMMYLRDAFDKSPEGSSGRMEAVEKILNRIGTTNTLTRMEEDRVLQYITDVSGIGIRMTTLRGQLKQIRVGEFEGVDHHEIARRFLDDLEQYHEIRKHNSALWKYTGSHWEPIDRDEIMAKIASEYGHFPAGKKYSDHKGIYSTLVNIAYSGIQTIDAQGVNFANGFLTEDLKLTPHDPEYGMTYTLPFRYVPELAGKMPMFRTFLEDCWGADPDRDEKVRALQEALCVTLFGMGPRYQRVILLKGVPKSGKSQLLKIAQCLVPENARSYVPPNDWGDRFLPAQMAGKLLNVCGELSERKRIDGQKFKDIVDGAQMQGQHKNVNSFQFKPICTHWFASNHTPKTDDTSEGFNRRWLVFEFNRPVPEEKRRIDIGDLIVAEEREAIVAWAVEAMGRLKERNEFTLPKSHRQLIREIAQENNSVRFFMEECPDLKLTGNMSDHILETTLYKNYWSFCLGPGAARPVTSRAFRAMMRELAHQYGIQMVYTTTTVGAQEVYYAGLTTAKKKAAS